jgi:PKHD-type hydroxylase
MSYQLLWYQTKLPSEVVNIIEKDIKIYDDTLNPSEVTGQKILPIRNSKNSWIPHNHWVCGLCYHYVMLANKENFKYDIESYGANNIQYTSYEEGAYYNWHVDTSISTAYEVSSNEEENFIKLNTEKQRKLSFSLQLSDPEEYSGGELQLLSDENVSFFAPKTKGTIIIFDSRMRHRVRKVTSGKRKSLVGWVVGPRWK